MAGEDPPKQVDQKLFQELRWRLIGPFRGGRVLAVTGVRGQPETYYFGAVGGGVWKTNDAGRTWRSEEHTSELQSLTNLVCRLLLEKKKKKKRTRKMRQSENK